MNLAIELEKLHGRYTAGGRLSLKVPVDVALDGGEPRTSLSSTRWALVTEGELGLEHWIGYGERPRQGYYWASLDEAGRILRLIPSDNVAGFVPEEQEREREPNDVPELRTT